jgi:hypothetical protein
MSTLRSWLFESPARFGVVALIGVAVAMSIFIVISLHDFLAVSNPVGEGIFVVEAWIPVEALAEVQKAFASGRYRYLVVVGYQRQQAFSNESNVTDVDRAARELEKRGVDNAILVKIRAPVTSTRKTYTSAVAVKQWLSSSGLPTHCVDVFTVGVHARKSWILFRYALGGSYRVGVIAGTPMYYDPKRWLLSASGRRLVLRNVGGCLYSEMWIYFKRLLST